VARSSGVHRLLTRQSIGEPDNHESELDRRRAVGKGLRYFSRVAASARLSPRRHSTHWLCARSHLSPASATGRESPGHYEIERDSSNDPIESTRHE
jgi:hypothetical protein